MMSNNNSTLFIDDDGEGGIPVVFIHSLTGNTTHWAAQLEHVRKTRRAVALDLRGHGRSNTAVNHTIEAMAQDVQTVVEQLGLESFILVGHSMGGTVAAEYVGMYPQNVVGLLLVDPSGDSTLMPAEQVEQYLGALQSDAYEGFIEGYWGQILTGSTAETEEKILQDLRSMAKETVVGVFNSLFHYSPVSALQKYNGPMLSIITPYNDLPISLHNLVPKLNHAVMTGTGHWLQLDKPEVFNQMLDGFLEQVGVETAV